MKCYYEILELENGINSTEEDIKRQYKNLALKYHPGSITLFLFV